MQNNNPHCDATQTLKKAGLAITIQRLAVLGVLIGTDKPVNAGQILEKVAATDQKINKVTVYRILASFVRGCLIREIETDRGTNYYEMACTHNPQHPHFNCRSCGTIICLSPLAIYDSVECLTQARTFSIERINVNISGQCSFCRNAA